MYPILYIITMLLVSFTNPYPIVIRLVRLFLAGICSEGSFSSVLTCFALTVGFPNPYSTFYSQPKKMCGDISIYTLKTKNYATQAGIPLGVLKNPLYKWVVTQDDSAVHEFRFSPDGKTIAIVSQV